MTETAPLEPPPAHDRAMRWRGRAYPVVLPKLTDARLHTAGVVMTIHVLGQVALGFAVSVPQILSAILVPATAEVVITAVRDQRLQWPASAMLTGSGVGLILRVEGTTAADHWTFHRWYVFAAVAGVSLATKYLIRWRGTHVFNPSNVGLVVAFVLLGSRRAEPLDLHWAPMGLGMAIAYSVILGGGLAITSRLGLVGMALAFWLALVTGLGVLISSGHCIVAPWSLQPVCDGRFWWTFATSPEILIFLFFMITDPKTVPSGRRARLAFGVAVGVVATLLIAPHTTEFGAKVGLLASLTIVTIGWRLGSAAPAATLANRLDRVVARAAGRFPTGNEADVRGTALGLAVPVALLAFVVATVQLGGAAREPIARPIDAVELPALHTILEWSEPVEFPRVTADERVAVLGEEFAEQTVQIEAVAGMLRALATEAEILRRRDPSLLRAVDHGARLTEMTTLIAESAGEAIAVREYTFEDVRLTAVSRGRQSGPVLAAQAGGVVRKRLVAIDGTITEERVESAKVEIALRQGTDGRWLIVDVRTGAEAD